MLGIAGLIVAGLLALVVGAELVLRAAAKLATMLGVKPLLVGLTIVSVGTSAPELAVGITASLEGQGGLAVGNIAGTNIVNILLILGLSAWLKPLPLELQTLRLDLPVMLFSALVLTGLSLDGLLSRSDGLFMVLSGLVYTFLLVRMSRAESEQVQQEFKQEYGSAARLSAATVVSQLAVLIAGLVIVVAGADWLVDGAVGLARAYDVPEVIIGLTIVAIGTSAPELVTTIIATLKDQRDVAVGNLIGSSVYNVLFILGVTCLVPAQGVEVERSLLLLDLPLMAAVVVLCVPVFVTGRRVSRGEGALFVTLYLMYLTWLVSRAL